METKTINGVSRSHLGSIRSELRKFGITVPEGDDVTVEGPLGVKMGVRYSEPESALTLTIIDKPAFVSKKQIWSIIDKTAGKFTS